MLSLGKDNEGRRVNMDLPNKGHLPYSPSFNEFGLSFVQRLSLFQGGLGGSSGIFTIGWSCDLQGMYFDRLEKGDGNNQLFITVTLQELVASGRVQGVA